MRASLDFTSARARLVFLTELREVLEQLAARTVEAQLPRRRRRRLSRAEAARRYRKVRAGLARILDATSAIAPAPAATQPCAGADPPDVIAASWDGWCE